jgi:hypothetical protein
MHIATQVEQTYTFTSGATEMARGKRWDPNSGTLSVPGPGTYNISKSVAPLKTLKTSKDFQEREEQLAEEAALKKKLKHIPKAPSPSKLVMIKEQLADKKEVERVDLSQYKEVAEFGPTSDWAKARLKMSEKARDQLT